MTMGWQPILDGDLADRAWKAIRDIADAMAVAREPAADLATFWSYVSAALEDGVTAQRTDDALARFAETLATGAPARGLLGGVAGLGWTASHVSDGADDVLALIDDSVMRWLASEWTGHFDLVDGLAGFGVYFLERGHEAGLARVLDHLEATASRDARGAFWHTPLRLLPGKQRATFPDGYTNLGLAHGTPGVIGVLARYPVADTRAHALRREAEAWLRVHDLGTSYPGMLDGRPPVPSRTAWCYGDPGVAIALWRSALADGRAPDHALAKRWLTRQRTGVVDAPLCHGAAGLAHIANRFFHASGDPEYRDAARSWYERTLAMQRPTGEFLASVGDGWEPKPDLLDGAAGVGLALLAAVTPLEPEWDRIMLCDLPISA